MYLQIVPHPIVFVTYLQMHVMCVYVCTLEYIS